MKNKTERESALVWKAMNRLTAAAPHLVFNPNRAGFGYGGSITGDIRTVVDALSKYRTEWSARSDENMP